MASQLTLADLEQELRDYQERYRTLTDDQLFIVWFLRAFVTEDETHAVDALCGVSKDKSLDAIFIDDSAKTVFLIQGKYRKKLAGKNESRNDVMAFADLAHVISGDNEKYDSFCENLAPETEKKFAEARKRVLRGQYKVQLYYVTIGRCSKTLADEAKRSIRSTSVPTMLDIIDGKQLLILLSDYLNGVAPPVPSLDLEMESGNGIELKGTLQRYDSETDIETWVFPMSSHAIGGLYERAGLRLFARNIRGFLGSTEINRQIEATLKTEPEYFWYYNNGVTIICDSAEEVRSHGRQSLRVTNPQIINGQQTTRTLQLHGSKANRASTLVKVIRVPRDAANHSDRFDNLVSKIVSATNWQNKINPSDLKANDRKQVILEREMRKLGYFYIRKRMTKSEARRVASSQRFVMVRKEEIAQAVAGCDLDPVVPRTEKEGLFEDRLYSKVFGSSDPRYYLTRYRLLKEVNYHARGKRQRKYAKWLVLNVVWASLGPMVRAKAAAELFLAGKNQDAFIGHLSTAINAVFQAVNRFYVANRGSGADALDVATFFKRQKQHVEFKAHWGRTNDEAKFERAMNRVELALKAAE